jgi:hypothetical protein
MTEVLSVLKYIWNHRANNNRRLTVIIYGVAWQLYKRITGYHFDIKIFYNIKIRCYPNSTSASSLIYCSGMPDFHEMRFMKDYLRKGDGFIDVGANIGAYTLLAASLVGSSGRVDSIHPRRTLDQDSISGSDQQNQHAKKPSSPAGFQAFTLGIKYKIDKKWQV